MGGRHKLEKRPEKGSFNMEQDTRQGSSMKLFEAPFRASEDWSGKSYSCGC